MEEWVLLISLAWAIPGYNNVSSATNEFEVFASKSMCSAAAKAVTDELKNTPNGANVRTYGRVFCFRKK
jgi:hypothetical protein